MLSADDYVVILPEIVEDFGGRPADKEEKTALKKPRKKKKRR
jgi:hypothetical protein